MSSAFLSAASVAHRRARSSDLMAVSLVEVMGCNQCAHRIGNEIADAPALGNPLADFCGGNIHPASNGGELVGRRVGGALEDHELRQLEEVLVAAPLGQVADVVLPDEVEQLILWGTLAPLLE